MLSHSHSAGLSWGQRPLRALIRLAWPITVSMLSISFMAAIDTLFVGHLGAAPLAGVALAAMAAFTVMCFGGAVMRGTKIAVAQAVGAGRPDKVQAYLGASLWAAAVIGGVSLVLGEGVAQLLPRLTASAESGACARSYAMIRMLGAPLYIATTALREVRHGQGDSRSPMLSALAGNISNLALVVLFMYGWGWGVAGAAGSTVIAQLIELGVMAGLQRKQGFGHRAFVAEDLRAVLRLGLPLGVERVLDVGSFSVVIALFARMGDLDLAAHQVANQVFLFAILPMMALGDASCVLVGQALGAGSTPTIPHVQRAALLIGYGYVTACCALVIPFGPQIAALFTAEAPVIARATELFHVSVTFLWLVPLYIVAQASLRGLGDVRAAALITVVAAWGCAPLFAAAFGIGLQLGALGGWIGIGAEFLIAASCFWWRLRKRMPSLEWVDDAELRPSRPAVA